jgi:hypothetical protein
MRTAVKDKKKALKPENLGQLEKFIGKLKKGEVYPFEDKAEQARKDLKKSGLIK